MDDADYRLALPKAGCTREIMRCAERIIQAAGNVWLHRLGEIARHHEHVAIDVEFVGRRQRTCLLTKAQCYRDRHRSQHMSGIDLAEYELITDRSPTRHADQIQRQTFGLREPFFMRGDQHRGIG